MAMENFYYPLSNENHDTEGFIQSKPGETKVGGSLRLNNVNKNS